MGFIAGFANAGSDAIDRRLGQIQQQEDTAYQLVAQRFLDNSRKRTEANAADEARIRSAHTLAEQAGMPDAWTHAYDMLVAGLTPLQVAAKLDESTFSPFDPNGPEAQQTAPTDATASESTQDAGQPVDLMQQGSQGPNQPASNAVDISTLNPIQNFINTGMGGIFNRANRTSSRMEQMGQRFRTNMGISEDEYNTVMNDTFQPQTMTHTGQLVNRPATPTSADYDGVVWVYVPNENGGERSVQAFINEEGGFEDLQGNPINDYTRWETEEDRDLRVKLLSSSDSNFDDLLAARDGTLNMANTFMKLTSFLDAPENRDLLTNTAGIVAFLEGVPRELDTLINAGFNDDINTERDFARAVEALIPESTLSMVQNRAEFLSVLNGAAYAVARADQGPGVLTNKDVIDAVNRLRGNTTNPIVFYNNLKTLLEQQINKSNTLGEGIMERPIIKELVASGGDVSSVTSDIRTRMNEAQLTWYGADPKELYGERAEPIPDDETPDAVDEMLDPSTDEQDLNTVIQRDETTGITVHRIENMDGGRMAVKYSLDGQNLLVIEVTRQELNDPRFYELLLEEANNQ